VCQAALMLSRYNLTAADGSVRTDQLLLASNSHGHSLLPWHASDTLVRGSAGMLCASVTLLQCHVRALAHQLRGCSTQLRCECHLLGMLDCLCPSIAMQPLRSQHQCVTVNCPACPPHFMRQCHVGVRNFCSADIGRMGSCSNLFHSAYLRRMPLLLCSPVYGRW
jgi:hypothetical protein